MKAHDETYLKLYCKYLNSRCHDLSEMFYIEFDWMINKDIDTATVTDRHQYAVAVLCDAGTVDQLQHC